MPLIPFEPFRQLEAFRDEMNRWMSQSFPNWAQQAFSFGPRVDVSQTDKEVIIEAEIPGLTKEDDLQIDVHPTHVVLSGEIQRSAKKDYRSINRTQTAEHTQTEQRPATTSDDEQSSMPDFYHTERYVGRFRRVISLPTEVDDKQATAEYHNGILEIRLPKAMQEKGRRLDVRFH